MQKESELFAGEDDFTATAPYAAPVRVDDEVTDREGRGRDFATASRHRAQARQQLAEIKWLGEVVVCACVQTGDTLVDAVERGQHENGNEVAPGANSATHRDPVCAG